MCGFAGFVGEVENRKQAANCGRSGSGMCALSPAGRGREAEKGAERVAGKRGRRTDRDSQRSESVREGKEMEELKVIDVQRTSLMEITPVREQKRRREPRTSLSEIVTWCLIGAGIGAWGMLLLCLA